MAISVEGGPRTKWRLANSLAAGFALETFVNQHLEQILVDDPFPLGKFSGLGKVRCGKTQGDLNCSELLDQS